MSLKEVYVQYGVPSNLADKYEMEGISASTFKATSQKNLITRYNLPKSEIKFVKDCLVRQPISDEIVQKLLENSRFTCCLCKGNKSDAYIIHHITEYSITKDNSYPNLAVLCPNDHDLAHRKGISLTNKISQKQIRNAKTSWEKQVKKENKEKAIKPKGIVKGWEKILPYKELLSYTENDKEYFFGRKKETEEILNKINKYNIVGLFGESGTGKTSLVNAGLIPNFRHSKFIAVSVRCLDEPIKRIREGLIKELKINNVSNEEIEELASIDTFPHLIIKLKSLVEKINMSLIIVVDQFEELFTRAREFDRDELSKGINESLIVSSTNRKIYFLLSLREDYIGELWDWAHKYNLEDAWIHQYRIKRLDVVKAYEAIVEPLYKLGIKVEEGFINQLLTGLKKVGSGLIYPPYLQIICSELFERYKDQTSNSNTSIVFGFNLCDEVDFVESIIADYLSESMLKELTEEEKGYAQNILDLLTGPEGLRSFLNIEEISRYLTISNENALRVIERLIKKKIVHPVVEEDIVIGYELVHDFLSKKFFEKLGPDAQRSKTTIQIFRQAFKEWKQHGVLASKDRLEILLPNIKQLNLNTEEWTFLIKSSFSVYWDYENKWTKAINVELLTEICLMLIDDKDERIVEGAINSLGKTKSESVVPKLINIIESSETSISVRDRAIAQFSFNLNDKRVIGVLKNVIKHEKNFKLRKSAVYAFGKNIKAYSNTKKEIIDKEISVLFDALNDSMTQVRKEVADVLGHVVFDKKSINPLLERLKKEISVSSRKAIVSALIAQLKDKDSIDLIAPILATITSDEKEDYRVREEARLGIQRRLSGL